MRDFLKPLGMSQSDFALRIGVSGVCIHQIVSGKNRVRARLALRFAAALQKPARFWLDLQTEYDLYVAAMDEYEAIERREISPINMTNLPKKAQ